MIRVLIADQDPAFRKALALLITRKLGVRHVDEAADIGALIQKLADSRSDLLLLNWSLHGTSGPEICILLRNTYPNLKVILTSLHPEDAAVAHSVEAGFICKSSPLEETLAVLTAYLNQDE